MDLKKRHRPLVIYGHDEDRHFKELAYLDYTMAQAIHPERTLRLGQMAINFTRNDHPDPCYSMRFEGHQGVFTYIADTSWTDSLIDTAREADLLVCESSLYDEYRGVVPGHLTAGEAGRIAAKAKVKHLVLSHLPHFGDHRRLVDQAGAQYPGTVELAATAKSWTLS
jgi:ribonuclease BN (tRNA processing enzyme)